jgi:hypothetical protein
MFAVISYSFQNGADVKIHAITYDEYNATKLYNTLSKKPKYTPNPDANIPSHTLLELVEIPDNFINETGHTLFWGEKSDNVITLKSNNQ